MRTRFPALALSLGAVLVLVGSASAQVTEHDQFRDFRLVVAPSIGIPGGLGGSLELRIAGPVGARAIARGIHGTVARGVGLAASLVRSDDGRIYLASEIGTLKCAGDTDGECSSRPRGRSWALGVTIGGEFRAAASGDWGVGVDVDRWFSLDGPQSSCFAAVFFLSLHL